MTKKKIIWLLMCVLLLTHHFQAHLLALREPYNSRHECLAEKGSNSSSLQPQSRQKRWVGTLIHVSIEATDLALSVANAVQGGCVYYPRICINKERIKELEDKEKNITKIIGDKQHALLEEVRSLYTVFATNNMLYEKASDIVTVGLDIVNITLWKTEFMKSNYEYRINATNAFIHPVTEASVEEMFEKGKEHYFKMLGITIGVKAVVYFIYRFVFKALWKGITSVISNFASIAVSGSTSFAKNKMSFKNLYIRYRNEYRFNGQTGHTVSKMTGKTSLIRAKTNVNGFIKAASKSFKINVQAIAKSKTFWASTSLVAIGAAVNQGLQAHQYKKFNDEMENLYNDHYIFYETLKQSYENLTKVEKELEDEWQEVIMQFKNLTLFFQDMQNSYLNMSATKQEHVKTVLDGIGEVFNIDFKNIARENILEKQNTVLSFLQKTTVSLITIRAQLLQEFKLYSVVKESLNISKPVDHICELINGYLDNDIGQHRKVGLLTVLCEIASQFDGNFYDYFELSSFRPTCPDTVNMEEIKKTREVIKVKEETIKNTLSVCEQFPLYCPPLPIIAKQAKVTVEELKNIIKHLRPNLTSFNGVPL